MSVVFMATIVVTIVFVFLQYRYAYTNSSQSWIWRLVLFGIGILTWGVVPYAYALFVGDIQQNVPVYKQGAALWIGITALFGGFASAFFIPRGIRASLKLTATNRDGVDTPQESPRDL